MHHRSASFAVGFALAAAWVVPAAGQSEFVKVPIALEHIVLTTAGPGAQPVSLPVSAPVNLVAPCGSFPGATVTMNVVDNGIDLALAGAAAGCAVTATLRFDVVLDVPVVSTDAVAFVVLVPEAGPASLANTPIVPGAKGTGLIHFIVDGKSTSAALPIPLASDIPEVKFDWTSDPVTLDVGSTKARMIPLIPGDQVRIPVTVTVSLKSATANGDRVDGSVSAHFEFQTRLPLPVSGLAPSLSLPIGVIGLTGLALLRG